LTFEKSIQMALTVARGKRSVRRFTVYDLEWIPGSVNRKRNSDPMEPSIRLCGVRDERGYRYYTTIRAFLSRELTSANRGRWFYAHAGGLADVQFVLETLILLNEQHKQWEIRASFSGSSAIIVHVLRGKNAWHFVDSYWLLRDKLANIGTFVGIEKGAQQERMSEESAKAFYAHAPLEQLIQYNRVDCEILYQAIDAFETRLLDMGGQLQMTIASCALHLFRRKFLRQDIDTCYAVNEVARNAYCASRVEALADECGAAQYYDINSSFPYSMTYPAPGELIGSSRYLPDPESSLYLARVDLGVPDTYFPPLPYRLDGRLFFPVGKWSGWLSNVDIGLLLKEGGKVYKVHEVLEFEPFHALAEYATTMYEHRRRSTDPFERIVDKYLMNALYGKFAETACKTQLRINPGKAWLVYADTTNGSRFVEQLFPGAWLEDRYVPVPHMHVPISVHITALSRRLIYNYINLCADVYYCDTDGFATTTLLGTGDGLGKLKLEKTIHCGHFYQPKLYQLELDNGDILCRGKGFPNLTPERMTRLVEGGAIEYERMARVRENFRKGRIRPIEHQIQKRIRNELIGKRFLYPDGMTRPWQIRELQQGLSQAQKTKQLW
jgi:hypothetical protein